MGQKQPTLVMAGRTYFSKPALSAGHIEIYYKPMEDLFFENRIAKACIYGLQGSFWVRYVNVWRVRKNSAGNLLRDALKSTNTSNVCGGKDRGPDKICWRVMNCRPLFKRVISKAWSMA